MLVLNYLAFGNGKYVSAIVAVNRLFASHMLDSD